MKLNELNFYDIGYKIGLVRAVFGDEEAKVNYLCMFPDQPVREQEVLRMDLEDWKKFLFQLDVLEVEILQKTEHGKLVKSILRKTQRLVDQRINWKVFRRDKYTCRYCGDDDVPMTVDHLILWEDGGPTIEENLVAACRKCNKTRGDMAYSNWLNHPYYLKVSKNVQPAIRARNEGVLGMLDTIHRVKNTRKRK